MSLAIHVPNLELSQSTKEVHKFTPIFANVLKVRANSRRLADKVMIVSTLRKPWFQISGALKIPTE
jgi:hypothetical protein